MFAPTFKKEKKMKNCTVSRNNITALFPTQSNQLRGFIIALSFVILNHVLSAQFNQIEWAKCYGGSATESAGTAVLNSIGGTSGSAAYAGAGEYYVVTSSNSTDGILYGNKGGDDVWLAKIDNSGDTLWTKVIGGSDSERAYKVRSLSTGGCVIVGQTLSNNGSFSGNQGINDAFAVRYSASGQLIWSKLYGGSALDFLYDIVETPEGNLVACGDTGSNDGDLFGTGNGLCWVLWINGSNGNVLDSKTYSSTNSSSPDYIENFTCINRLSDNSGFILSGFSTPSFFDFNGDDIFVAKINNAGALQWTTLVGSTTAGEGSASIIDGGSGQFYIAGRLSGAFDGVTYNGGNGDAWLIKFDANGSLLWNKNYGGTNWDSFTDATRDSQGNLYLSAYTRSVDVDLSSTTPQGLVDFWVLKTDPNGILISSRRLGGSENDFGLGIAFNEDENEVLIIGRTESNNGDVSGNYGGRDLLAVKLNGDVVTVSNATRDQNDITIYPIPAIDKINITYPSPTLIPQRIDIVNGFGKKVLTIENNISDAIDLVNLSSGIYSICFWYKGTNEPIVKTIIKE